MSFIKTGITAAVAAILVSTGASSASSFKGAYWDANAFASIDQAYAYIDNNAATATFDVTAIDYPEAGKKISDTTLLKDFLGATGDGLSLTGAANNQLDRSAFKFTGVLDLMGVQTIKVGSDDGFGLTLNGVEVLRYSDPRSFAYTSGTYDFDGETSFELVYYENYGATGVEFQINDTFVNTAMAYDKAAVPSVPVPAALPLLMGALGGLGVLRRRRANRT